MFAKLFGNDENQVLVVLNTDDEGNPTLSFSFEPKNLGVCSVNIKYEDSDNGWDKAEKTLSEMNEETARKVIAKTKTQIESSF